MASRSFPRVSSRRTGFLVVALLFLFGSLVGNPVVARDICVSNSAELQAALLSAGRTLNPDRVLLQTGTYHLGADGLDYNYGFPASIAMEGGYGPQCGSRSHDPELTVINGDGQSGLSITYCGDFRIDGLTLTGMESEHAIAINSYSAGCWGHRSVTIDHSIIRGNGGSHALWISPTNSETRILNSLIVDNASTVAAIYAQLSGRVNFDISHSTVANNAGIGVQFSQYSYNPRISNSVVWGNLGGDLKFEQAVIDAPVLRRTIYGTLTGNVAADSTGAVVADPLFVDPATGDYRLGNGSPAINAGSPALMDGGWTSDLDELPRWIGSRPDLGAFESANTDQTEIVVSTNADSGVGSLRQAILDANAASDPVRIRFAIGASCGPHVILLDSALPAIDHDVEIDGFSQPGASPSTAAQAFDATICIVLRANDVLPGALPHALKVANGSTASLVARGLAFTGFVDTILLEGGDEHLVVGSRFDGRPPIIDSFGGNSHGVRIGDNAGLVQVGGNSPAWRNLISGTLIAGVRTAGSHQGAMIFGNLIGTSPDGQTAVPNVFGLFLQGWKSQIRDNIISGNSADGVVLVSGHNQVFDNRVGLNADQQPLGNGLNGIHIYGNYSANLIGGRPGRSNSIAFNGDAGVWIEQGAAHEVIDNRIFQNNTNGGAWLNIDLDLEGPEANDVGDTDIGANGLQNHPLISGISEVGTTGKYQVSYSYNGRNKPVYFSFFSAPSCPGNGRGDLSTLILVTQAGTDLSGNTSGTVTMPGGIASAAYFTMTATTEDGTSEPSPCMQAPWLVANAKLDALSPSVGQFNPAFDPDEHVYTVELPYVEDAIQLTAQANDPLATVQLAGESLGTAGTTSPISLAVGANNFEATVTARDGVSEGRYFVTVIRAVNQAAWLEDLSLSIGTLSPTFLPIVGEYAADVANGVNQTTVTAVLHDAAAGLKINGIAASNGVPFGPIPLAIGNNHITVEVSAADLSEVRTYDVYINRADNENTRLHDLTVSAGALSPAFAAHLFAYTVNVDSSVSQIVVTPTPEESGATATVNGLSPVLKGGPYPPTPLVVGDNSIEVLVTAANGVAQKLTTITVHRDAPSGLDIFSNGFDD